MMANSSTSSTSSSSSSSSSGFRHRNSSLLLSSTEPEANGGTWRRWAFPCKESGQRLEAERIYIIVGLNDQWSPFSFAATNQVLVIIGFSDLIFAFDWSTCSGDFIHMTHAMILFMISVLIIIVINFTCWFWDYCDFFIIVVNLRRLLIPHGQGYSATLFQTTHHCKLLFCTQMPIFSSLYSRTWCSWPRGCSPSSSLPWLETFFSSVDGFFYSSRQYYSAYFGS